MKQLIIGVLLSVFSLLVQAEIKIQVEPGQITAGEAFRLTLTQEDPQNSGVPDLTVLQKDFVILGTERNVNYSIINGQAQSNSQWIIALRAKAAGVLTIPAIKIGLEESIPMTINVDANAKVHDVSADPSQQQSVFLTGTIDAKKPYVSQQIIYTVRLYVATSQRLLDARYQEPKVDDALVIPLGSQKRYETIQNNINYVVEELNYAIFPQKSGTLKIISPTFTALVYDLDPQRIQVQDKPIYLTVQPIPQDYKGKEWLPAKQVKLTEQYEHSNQTLSQGSTLIRTVTLEGIGIPAQLLPTLHFSETDGFNVYPEKGADNNQIKQGELYGSTEIKVTYLFNKAGKVTIPELKLPWFNTQTGKEELAVLAPRSIDVSAASGTVNNTTQQMPDENKAHTSSLTTPASNNWAWIVATLLALGWLITAGLWIWQRRARHLGKGKYKNALNELNKACAEGNPQHARDALLKWASLHWPDAPLLNLSDLTHLVRDAHLKKQLHILSQCLYKNEARAFWRGDELLRAVNAIKRSKSGSQKRKPSVLPPINPL